MGCLMNYPKLLKSELELDSMSVSFNTEKQGRTWLFFFSFSSSSSPPSLCPAPPPSFSYPDWFSWLSVPGFTEGWNLQRTLDGICKPFPSSFHCPGLTLPGCWAQRSVFSLYWGVRSEPWLEALSAFTVSSLFFCVCHP